MAVAPSAIVPKDNETYATLLCARIAQLSPLARPQETRSQCAANSICVQNSPKVTRQSTPRL
jgi:hypothetical protein